MGAIGPVNTAVGAVSGTASGTGAAVPDPATDAQGTGAGIPVDRLATLVGVSRQTLCQAIGP